MGFIEAVIEHAVNLGDMTLSPQASGLPLASGILKQNEVQGFLYDPISAQAVGNSCRHSPEQLNSVQEMRERGTFGRPSVSLRGDLRMSQGNISPPYNAAAQTFAGRIPLEKSQTNGTSYATSPRTQLMMQMNTNPFLPPPYPMRSAARPQGTLQGSAANAAMPTFRTSSLDWSPNNPVTVSLAFNPSRWPAAQPQLFQTNQPPPVAHWPARQQDYADALASAVQMSSRTQTSALDAASQAWPSDRSQPQRADTGTSSSGGTSSLQQSKPDSAFPVASNSSQRSHAERLIALGNTRRCFGGCSEALSTHADVFHHLFKDSADANGEKRVSLKKQNDYLMDVLFDDAGELKYHSDCVVRMFTISKGRLSRLTERKKMVIRGEEQTHALNGRPSNNRKKPETLQQFMAFVKANRYLDPTDPSGNKYRLNSGFRRIQGDKANSVRVRFNLQQQALSTLEAPRETISSGTAQTWFKTYFQDTRPPLHTNQLLPGANDQAVQLADFDAITDNQERKSDESRGEKRSRDTSEPDDAEQLETKRTQATQLHGNSAPSNPLPPSASSHFLNNASLAALAAAVSAADAERDAFDRIQEAIQLHMQERNDVSMNGLIALGLAAMVAHASSNSKSESSAAAVSSGSGRPQSDSTEHLTPSLD